MESGYHELKTIKLQCLGYCQEISVGAAMLWVVESSVNQGKQPNWELGTQPSFKKDG